MGGPRPPPPPLQRIGGRLRIVGDRDSRSGGMPDRGARKNGPSFFWVLRPPPLYPPLLGLRGRAWLTKKCRSEGGLRDSAPKKTAGDLKRGGRVVEISGTARGEKAHPPPSSR